MQFILRFTLYQPFNSWTCSRSGPIYWYVGFLSLMSVMRIFLIKFSVAKILAMSYSLLILAVTNKKWTMKKFMHLRKQNFNIKIITKVWNLAKYFWPKEIQHVYTFCIFIYRYNCYIVFDQCLLIQINSSYFWT